MPAEKKRDGVSRGKRRGPGARRPAGRVPLSGHVGTCLQIVRTRHTTEHTNARNHPLPAPSRTGSGKSGRTHPRKAARADTAQKIRSPRRDRTTSIPVFAERHTRSTTNEIRNRRDSGYTIRMPLMRHDMLEELFERDAVIVTQISQRRKGDAVPTALDSPDIQISIKTHVFLRQATLPANGFQSLYNLLHQQVIAPLSFHIANYCNNEIKFYYILVSGGGISDISDAILHCLFPINTKISHLYPHGEPQIHGKTGSTSAQFVP